MAQVLLVEPDVKLAGLYAQALQTRQHVVAVAHSAQGAIVLADKQQPDVVLLELQLTQHGGIEFLYEFRSYPDWQRLPVVIISNVPPTEFAGSRQLLRDRLGVVAYHYKPSTSLRTLLHAVDNALSPV